MGCFPCVGRRGKTFHVKILLLDKQELIEEVKHESTTGQDLLDSVFAHLNLIETAYFGLRYQDSSNQTVRRWVCGRKKHSVGIFYPYQSCKRSLFGRSRSKIKIKKVI